MAATKLTSKHQTTVPPEVRAALGLEPGDTIVWQMDEHGVAQVRKARPMDWTFLKGVEANLAEEWLSPEDEEAWRDL